MRSFVLPAIGRPHLRFSAGGIAGVMSFVIIMVMLAALIPPLLSATPAQATTVGTAGLFVPAQGRLVDSRTGTGVSKAPLAPYTPRTVQATGAAGIPADGVSAVLVTMTAVAPTTAGQMSAGPADGAMTGVMRYDASPYTSNSAIVMVSDVGQIQIQATTTANVMVDVQGYYTAGNGVTAAGGYSPVKQTRTVDTVNGVGLPKAKLTGGSTSTIQVTGTAGVPAGAKAAFVNFQVNNANTTAGYFNPYATSATSRPGTSLNFDGSPFTSIGAIVPIAADGTIKVYLSTGNTIDLLMDVEGYFTPGGSSSDAGVFTPAIAKIYDTRAATHVAPGATVTIPVGGTNDIPSVGNGLSAITANLTVVDTGTAGGYVRAYASGTTEPTNVATLTFNKGTAGAYTTNLATIPVGTDNAIKIHNVSADTVDFILDLNGWYTKMPTVAFSCPTPFVGESWTEGTTPTMVNCTLTATNPYASPLTVFVAYDDDSESYGPYTVPAKASVTPAISIPAHGGAHVLTAETETPDEEPVVTSYEFTVGDWSTAPWSSSLTDGATTDLRPTLDYFPAYGTFPDAGSVVYTLSTNPDGRTNAIQTSDGSTREMQVSTGLLAPGTTYYWTATATGLVEGRQGLKTRTSDIYRFTTSAKYTSADEPTATIQFKSTDTDGYVAAYASILAENGPETTAAFFAQAAEDPAQIELPGLAGQTTETKQEVFQVSADAAASNELVTESDLPVEVQTTAGSQPEFEANSFSSAPVRGIAKNNGRSWYWEGRTAYARCSWFRCSDTDWIKYTFTVDPGKKGSRTELKFEKWGTRFGNVTLTSWVFVAGNNASVSSRIWSTPGRGTQYNSPHISTLNKTFQAWYEIKVSERGVGFRKLEFKTKKSAMCKEPAPQAYQCLF